MLGSQTNKVKPLSSDSDYYKDREQSHMSGNKALDVFGKSEKDELEDFWWDSIKKPLLPWRGGGIITTRGEFAFCVHRCWWSRDPRIIIRRLSTGTSIETTPKTVYFWMVDSYSPYTKEDLK